MRVHLKSSGGFANIEIQGQVDTDDLDPRLARRAKKVLRHRKLKQAAEAASPQKSPYMADSMEYHVTILPEDEKGRVRSYTVDENRSPAEVIDVLSELMHEVVQRKKAEIQAAESKGTPEE